MLEYKTLKYKISFFRIQYKVQSQQTITNLDAVAFYMIWPLAFKPHPMGCKLLFFSFRSHEVFYSSVCTCFHHYFRMIFIFFIMLQNGWICGSGESIWPTCQFFYCVFIVEIILVGQNAFSINFLLLVLLQLVELDKLHYGAPNFSPEWGSKAIFWGIFDFEASPR